MIVVIGTKLDLISADPTRRQVSEEDGERYARQHRASFYETSSKDNLNVMPVFDRVAYQCLAQRLANEESRTGSPTVDAINSRMVVASAASAGPHSGSKTCCSVQ